MTSVHCSTTLLINLLHLVLFLITKKKLIQRYYLRCHLHHYRSSKISGSTFNTEYDHDDDDFDDPLSEHNWLSQTRGKFMIFIILQIVQSQDQYPTKNKSWLVSRKLSKGKKLPILHSRMKGTLIILAKFLHHC